MRSELCVQTHSDHAEPKFFVPLTGPHNIIGWVDRPVLCRPEQHIAARVCGEEESVTNRETNNDTKGKPAERLVHRVRLPGFLIEEEIGLGDAIKRVTYAMGIKPCAGCEKRAVRLNRWLHFSR